MFIFFDVDDTLYQQISPFRLAYEELFAYPINLRELFVRTRYYSDKVFEQTGYTPKAMTAMHIYRIQAAMADFGYQISDETALQFQKLYAANQEKIKRAPYTTEVLTRLKKDAYRIGLITNGQDDHQRKKIRALQLERWIPENYHFTSEGLGYAKPDLRAFQKVNQLTQTEPADCLYIGDNYLNDVQGAKAAGWQSLWINHYGLELKADQVQADRTIDQYSDLMAAVYSLLD